MLKSVAFNLKGGNLLEDYDDEEPNIDNNEDDNNEIYINNDLLGIKGHQSFGGNIEENSSKKFLKSDQFIKCETIQEEKFDKLNEEDNKNEKEINSPGKKSGGVKFSDDDL